MLKSPDKLEDGKFIRKNIASFLRKTFKKKYKAERKRLDFPDDIIIEFANASYPKVENLSHHVFEKGYAFNESCRENSLLELDDLLSKKLESCEFEGAFALDLKKTMSESVKILMGYSEKKEILPRFKQSLLKNLL